jgi:hypothetical protein
MSPNDIENRLTILETTFNERWRNHDKRSEEVWTNIQKSISEIQTIQAKTNLKLNDILLEMTKNLGSLPCESHLEIINSNKKQIKWIWGIFIVSYGVILTYIFERLL